MALTLQKTLVCSLLMLCLLPVEAATKLEQQRKDFAAGHQAVRQKAVTRYRQILKRLDDYPLRDFLEYEYLRRHISSQKPEKMQAFITKTADSFISDRLRKKWLLKLASQGKWQLFVDNYVDLGNSKLACYYATGLQKLKKTAAANAAAEKLWLIGKSRPRACNAVFAQWRASGQATPELIWQRVKLAMHSRRPNLAKYLAKFLGPDERKWVARWRRMYRNPAKMLNHADFRSDTPLVREIVLHGLERLARRDAVEAAKRWQGIRTQYTFSVDDIGRTNRRIGISAATDRRPEAHALLNAVDQNNTDLTVHQWRIRSALNNGDWGDVLTSVESLPDDKKGKDSWRYWRARALNELGFSKQAMAIFTDLAGQHSYEGLLAADIIGVPYALDGVPINRTEIELKKMSAMPGIQRAKELFRQGLTVNARREWQFTIARLNPRQLELAAVLASQWGWHDRAVLTIGRTKTLGDLKLRYPIVYAKKVLHHAKRNRIDAAWVYGVIRQESAYMTDARSHAGALGLMQLMPGTARFEAKRLKLSLRNRNEILNIDKNIRLGTAHMKRILDINKGHKVLATASYNAGVQRVKSWLPKSAQTPADVWIETMPFSETRHYVKKVMATMAIFEKHLGQPVTPLGSRLIDIKPRS